MTNESKGNERYELGKRHAGKPFVDLTGEYQTE